MAKHVLIIGGGPAGCSAAMTLRLRGEDVTILYSGEGALGRAKRVDNYPGLAQMPGGEMLSAFRRQAEDMGAALRPGVARYIQRTRRGFTVLAGEDMIACDAVLLASGVARVNLIPGEEALVGRGVSYCATCDGMLYRDRPVAAVVLGAGFDEDVRFLQGICQVDVLTRPPRALRAEGERVILSTADSDTAYDCVFILRPAVALTTLLPALETADGAVRVDADMQTNIPGVFAAGDITGAPYQAARAVGQGNTAALSIARFLHQGDAINHESTN